MRKKITFMLLIAIFMLSLGNIPQASGYSTAIQGEIGVSWQIESAPSDAFNLYYTGGGNWVAQDDSFIEFIFSSFDDDVLGHLSIGNVTVLANDTEIAKDLTLSVWGTHTQWLPGFFVKVGQSDIDNLNVTAYSAAERLDDNYLNGTMLSSYETINAGNEQHQCIVFDYEQDPPGTQLTHLAYSLDTGVLIEANTSYSFGVTLYELAFRFVGFVETTVVDLTVDPGGTMIIVSGVIGGAILAVIVVVYFKLSRN